MKTKTLSQETSEVNREVIS